MYSDMRQHDRWNYRLVAEKCAVEDLCITLNKYQIKVLCPKPDSVGNRQPIGLQSSERNILSLLPDQVRQDIDLELEPPPLGDDELPDLDNDDLARYLNEDGICIMRDILNELSEVNDEWNRVSQTNMYTNVLKNPKNLAKCTTIPELKIIASILRHYTGRSWITAKMKKAQIVNSISSAFGGTEFLQVPEPKTKAVISKRPSVKSLKEAAMSFVMDEKYPVLCLRISIANALHAINTEEWYKRSHVPIHYEIPNSEEVYESFSLPEFNEERNQVEPRTMDVSHMLGNLRTACLKNEGIALASKDAWKRVADKNPEIVSRSIVYDNIDVQNVQFSKRFFSFGVENKMRENGDIKEADFVRTVRAWFMSCDMRGVSATARIDALLDMHKLLTEGMNFDTFPCKLLTRSGSNSGTVGGVGPHAPRDGSADANLRQSANVVKMRSFMFLCEWKLVSSDYEIC